MAKKKPAKLAVNANNNYVKSNFLIGAKYSATLLENKLMALSLAKASDSVLDDKTGNIVVSLTQSEIKKRLGITNRGFYTQLEQVASEMTGRTIGVNDEINHYFDYIAVVIRAKYEQGEFKITYNADLKDYIINIKNKFTNLNLDIMMQFNSVYSFRLYELLKSYAFKTDTITFGLAELKIALGIVNANLDSVKSVLNRSELPDYEKAVAKSPEKRYESYGEFNRSVLQVAVKEINETTDINVKYEPIKKGRGGKVVGITFTLESVPLPIKEELVSSTDELTFIEDLQDLFDEKLKISDLRAIAREGRYNYDYIVEKYEILKSSNTNIDNIVGWMIKALKEDYKAPISSGIKRKKEVNHQYTLFEKFQESGTDYDAIEDMLLDN